MFISAQFEPNVLETHHFLVFVPRSAMCSYRRDQFSSSCSDVRVLSSFCSRTSSSKIPLVEKIHHKVTNGKTTEIVYYFVFFIFFYLLDERKFPTPYSSQLNSVVFNIENSLDNSRIFWERRLRIDKNCKKRHLSIFFRNIKRDKRSATLQLEMRVLRLSPSICDAGKE